jgi:hypothetical protein
MDLGTPPKIGGETLFSLIENVIQNKRAKISPPGSGGVSSFEVRKG